jgi:hypothetical protein
VVGITKFLTEAAIQKSKVENVNLISIRLPNIAYTPGMVHLILKSKSRKEKH